MFYSSQAIQTLVDRIGWADTVPPSDFAVNSQNKIATSGRFVVDFHSLATAETVYDSIRNKDATEATLNDSLYKMKVAAVRKSLSRLFDNNPRANFYENNCNKRVDASGTDYSQLIISRASVFDDVLGYQLAVDTMELATTTSRSNLEERSNKTTWIQYRQELDGFFDADGKIVAKGLFYKLSLAQKYVVDILFPETNKTPAIKGVSPW